MTSKNNIIFNFIVTAQPNLNLPWNPSNIHQYFVTTPTQYFGLIVTAQPNLNMLWDARNLHQHFITAHPTPIQYLGLIVTSA